MTWNYSRGEWYPVRDYSEYDSPKTIALKEWLRKDALARRWKKFPTLGPVPVKWVNTDPKPPTTEDLLKAFYIGPVSAMLSEPSPLLKFLNK